MSLNGERGIRLSHLRQVLALGCATSLMAGLAGAATAQDADMPYGVYVTDVRIDSSPVTVVSDNVGNPYYYRADPDAPCDAACMEDRSPVAPPEGVELVGQWSVVDAGGDQQLAFRGRPLYTYGGEPEPVNKQVGEDRGANRLPPPEGLDPDNGWEVLRTVPDWVELPLGFATKESVVAQGQILVTQEERPLYSFSGSDEQALQLPRSWIPFTAGLLDIPRGRFTIAERSDGLLVWEFDGEPLFTYNGDIEIGDLNGQNVNPAVEPAVLNQYFVPEGIVVAADQRRGGRLVDASTGHTLYARDRHFYSDYSYYSRGAGRGSPDTGRVLGVSTCDAACETEWAPLIAPADAKGGGNWTLMDRPDGQQQWAYRGYALYSYRNEEPGQTLGQERWTLTFDDGTRGEVNEDFGLALWWRLAVP